MPRTAIKAQALADFVMECTFPESQLKKHVPEYKEKIEDPGAWKLFVDRSATAERSGAGSILVSPKGFNIQQAITFAFKATTRQNMRHSSPVLGLQNLWESGSYLSIVTLK